MKTLAERISEAREALKKQNPLYTQSYVAKQLGIEQQSYGDIESGKSKRPRNIEKLAKILLASPEWLQFGKGSPPEYLNDSSIPEGKAPILQWSMVKNWIENHNIEEQIQASAFRAGQSGAGQPLISLEYTPVPDKKNDKVFALKIKGDSMTPAHPGTKTFLEGDTIIIDPEQTPKNMDFIIALQNGSAEAIFKQYIHDGNKIYLRPLNPQYPLIPVDETIKICGVVIAHLGVLL